MVEKNIEIYNTQVLKGRKYIEIGVVRSYITFSRNFISDFGSGFKSVFGGRLKGIDKSYYSASDQTLNEISQQAKTMGGDAIIALNIDISTTPADKGGYVVASIGTAIKFID